MIHIKIIHQGQRNHKCDYCGKFYTRMTNLKINFKIVHEDQENFLCDSCEKFFTLKQNLKTRIKNVHEGKRNYKCDTHKNVVNGKAKNFESNFCSQTFK